MSQQENVHATKRFGEAINQGKLDTLRQVMAPGVVDHDPAPDQAAGPEGFVQFFEDFRDAFPDLEVSVEHMVCDDENVAIAYTVTGTQQGDFLGVPATGRQISARGMQIARFADGKIVERWGSSDQLGILKQLGANPAAG
ncbi:MAG: ester cyclase [Gammaproteobacteria bacterium]|nr:ester cyclase [Gammaproteobacteria bacterium]